MWSQGSSPLWEYVQPSQEATKTCTISNALCRGAPAALFPFILAPSGFNWWPPIAGTVREGDNQSFCRLFLYTQESPLSRTDVSYLTHLFLVQQPSLPLIFSSAFFWTFASSAIKLLRDFLAHFIRFLCNFSQLVLVFSILNNLVFLISFLTSPFSKFSINTLNSTDLSWTVAYSLLRKCCYSIS